MTMRLPDAAHRWWPFLFVVAAYAVVALQQVTLPGVYMDAVNPDYMAVLILNHRHEEVLPWLLPGNLLSDRYPILISYYHGSQQMWLGLPFFWLFGTTVTGLRLTHAMFALGVLATMYAFVVRSGLKPWQAAAACAALAIDPSFSYAFRTQSYITLAPAAWLFLTLYSMTRIAQSPDRQGRWLFAGGLCYGFAVVAYFIYAFFLPALVLAMWWYRAMPRRTAAWLALLGGLLLGSWCYPVGYWLTVEQFGSVHAAWNYFQQTQRAIAAFSGQPDLAMRLDHAGSVVASVFRNWYHHTLIFGEYGDVPGGGFKMSMLLGLPLFLWALAEWRKQQPVALRVIVALAASFVLVALVFGTRLSGHHFMVLLPLSYSALALGLVALSNAAPAWRTETMTVALPFAALAALNVGGQVKEALQLREVRGVGLYSDAINRLAADLAARPTKPYVYLPDWGLYMPVAFLTGGRIALDSMESYDAARRRLCEGRDVAVGLVTGDRAARVVQWQEKLRWDTAATVTPYRQSDGKVVFELATFAGRRDGPGC